MLVFMKKEADLRPLFVARIHRIFGKTDRISKTTECENCQRPSEQLLPRSQNPNGKEQNIRQCDFYPEKVPKEVAGVFEKV